MFDVYLLSTLQRTAAAQALLMGTLGTGARLDLTVFTLGPNGHQWPFLCMQGRPHQSMLSHLALLIILPANRQNPTGACWSNAICMWTFSGPPKH